MVVCTDNFMKMHIANKVNNSMYNNKFYVNEFEQFNICDTKISK